MKGAERKAGIVEHKETLGWLLEQDESRLDILWRKADSVRRENVGDAVHLRGLIEFSNHCARSCGYCGLRAPNAKVRRYRMTKEEILECASQAVRFGYGTVVLQSGEDPGIRADWMSALIQSIREQTNLAITLSLGERSEEEFALWREAGADRYLLRFETSNPALFEKIHPSLPGKNSDRPVLLRTIKRLGYEVGSGVMVGIPGQAYEDLARDIELFRELNLDMIGIGPYIAHPDTPLGALPCPSSPSPTFGLQTPDSRAQVPNSELMTYKMVALARIACPKANIPSTTALATLNLAQGRELGLCRGANIVMPNLTPAKYRALYEIYPAKACIQETAEQCHGCMRHRIESIGRMVGTGRGDSPNKEPATADL